MNFNFNHKFSKEDMDKLPQLDRIELRQKIHWLEENKVDVGLFPFLFSMLIIIGFIILLTSSLLSINLILALKIFYLIPTIVKLTILGVIFLFLLKILFTLTYIKNKKEIYTQYFEQKIEVKKKK